jgi:hypothetical protein
VKKITAISFAFLMLALAAKDFVMLAAFKINQEYIAKSLCINQDKPEMHCKGKCYLKKKISENKEKDQGKAPIAQPDEHKQTVYFQPHICIKIQELISSHIQTYFIEPAFSGQSFHADIFQPPRALAVSLSA